MKINLSISDAREENTLNNCCTMVILRHLYAGSIILFIERAIETLQYEFINLQYHATFEDFQNFLVMAENGYNLREHSSFNYRSPLEIWNSSGVSLDVTAGGLWT